ncbi:MAG: hypothetical protein U0Q11_02335 [Vicinamibacterales bacterium]
MNEVLTHRPGRARGLLRRSALIGLTVAVLGLAAACSSGDAHSPYFGKVVPPAGQDMRYISGSEPESLDPPVSSSQVDARIIMALFDGLTGV